MSLVSVVINMQCVTYQPLRFYGSALPLTVTRGLLPDLYIEMKFWLSQCHGGDSVNEVFQAMKATRKQAE